MRIAVDTMGGDHAPESIVQGAVQAAIDYNYDIILVGDEQVIKKELSKYSIASLPITIQNATETISENDSPTIAFRQKKDSSIMVCARLIKENRADALVSAGNSGATMTSALATLGRLNGIIRPAIAIVMPTLNGMCVILDVGANVDCKPQNLVQFAIMGEVYMKHMFGKKNPTVGLLNLGKEENKGNELTFNTYKLLKESKVNFIGNIEGGDIPKGKTDVVVCDGFVGNVILKLSEGVVSVIFGWFKEEIVKRPLIKVLAGMLLKSVLGDIRKRVNYDEIGGAPLLGINGACIVCHGISNARAIRNSIKVAARFVEEDTNSHIEKMIMNGSIR